MESYMVFLYGTLRYLLQLPKKITRGSEVLQTAVMVISSTVICVRPSSDN